MLVGVNNAGRFPLKTAEVVVAAPASPVTFGAATSGQL